MLRSVERGFPGYVLLIRILAGVLFLYAGLSKLQQPYDFLATIYDYRLIGPPAGRYLAMVLPHLEIIVGICLLGGVLTSSVLLTASLMLVAFTIAQASVLARGLIVNCGCFSVASDAKVTWLTILRTGAAAALVAVATAMQIRREAALAGGTSLAVSRST